MKRRLIAVLAVTFASASLSEGSAAQVATTPVSPASKERAARLQKERDNLELQRVPPFKVFDNLYYVGVGWVASWLLTTDQGLILIDTLEEPHADHLLQNIRKIGFDPKAIKYVLITHAHADHVGAVADIQEMYGARVVMMEGDWNLFTGVSAAVPEARAPRRDVVARDGETLTLGTTTVRLWSHPGHTPGVLSLDFTVYDGGMPYQAFIFAGAAPAPGLQAAQQFVDSINRLEQNQRSVQVRVVSHPWMDPIFWDRADRLAQRRPGDPHPFVDSGVFPAWIAELKEMGLKRLEQTRTTGASAN